jgi:hypothetical protein
MSSYFAHCAVFMLWLAFRAHSRGVGQSGQTGPLSPAPTPTHTHKKRFGVVAPKALGVL